LKACGRNELAAPERTSLLKLIAEQFEDRLVQILLVVAVISSVLSIFEDDTSAFIEPVVIVAILVINALVGIWQGRSAEGALDALKKASARICRATIDSSTKPHVPSPPPFTWQLQPENACVLRDGRWIADLPAAELVPGDFIFVKVGDKVPADARLYALKTTTFSTDEGSLTGESASVSKSLDAVPYESRIQSKTNMIFSGTMVRPVAGSAPSADP
jgi:P-type Ca2+ transporter type 2C